jgi:hypothetical protein
MAEALANLQHMIIEMDTKIFVDGILSTAHDDSEFGAVLQYILSLYAL